MKSRYCTAKVRLSTEDWHVFRLERKQIFYDPFTCGVVKYIWANCMDVEFKEENKPFWPHTFHYIDIGLIDRDIYEAVRNFDITRYL